MNTRGSIVSRFPLITFLLCLAVLFAVIVFGSKMRQVQTADKEDDAAQERIVDVYDANTPKSFNVLGEVDRADTITLVATSGGIVQRVALEGAYAYRGGEIARVADTYGGGSVASVAQTIAKRSLEYQKEVYDDQKKILDLEKDALNKTDRDEVKIARKQISLQKRANEFNLDAAQLQVQQAGVQAALQRTSAPFAGRIQSTFVRVGDVVSPGTPIAVLQAENIKDAQVVAYVGAARAASIDLEGRAYARSGGEETDLEVVHIATTPTQAGSYAITLALKDVGKESSQAITAFNDGTFLDVHLPIGSHNIIPLDAVHYGTVGPEIFVIKDGLATAAPVVLGDVIGAYVTVREGLVGGDAVILDRNIAANEAVRSR